LAGVAKALADVGQLELAWTVAARILAAAKAISDYSDRAETLTALARVLVKLGRGDQALDMVRTIGVHEISAGGLAAIAYDLVWAGELQTAMAVIECALAAARINGRASFFRLLGELAGCLSIITPQDLYEIGQEVVNAEKLWRE
jgi:hypothetical protein